MTRLVLFSLFLNLAAASTMLAEAIPVKIIPGTGITRGGQPYFVKGAGGDQHLDDLAAAGGNSLRTWTTNGLGAILDEAQKRGLTVCAGIWIEPECSWFSYEKPEHCARQLEQVKKEVMQFRDHPALLFWGIGNEVEGDGNNAAYWQQLEVLAKAVKELDPSHPTFTAVRDVMQELWTGQPPPDRAPELVKLTSNASKKVLAPGAYFTTQAEATDTEGDPLTWHWSITAESAGRDTNDHERPPPNSPTDSSRPKPPMRPSKPPSSPVPTEFIF